ncbi:hypothetical protein SAMN05216167_10547 [Spirosoma endophyticum]|uniref:Uncharacterized protein n=1 Tax=Spirosoma endophyticum TaxID=662367 RepID=A0A1I1SBW4_9BACT|nr:hypothetical protein SAMN05216167_10547 [Spirosoma endophyticum]
MVNVKLFQRGTLAKITHSRDILGGLKGRDCVRLNTTLKAPLSYLGERFQKIKLPSTTDLFLKAGNIQLKGAYSVLVRTLEREHLTLRIRLKRLTRC